MENNLEGIKWADSVPSNNQDPYRNLAMNIVLKAVEDYIRYVKAKKKGRLTRTVLLEGLSAKKFLHSRKANWYMDNMEVDILAVIDKRLAEDENLKMKYERMRKEHAKKRKQTRKQAIRGEGKVR